MSKTRQDIQAEIDAVIQKYFDEWARELDSALETDGFLKQARVSRRFTRLSALISSTHEKEVILRVRQEYEGRGFRVSISHDWPNYTDVNLS